MRRYEDKRTLFNDHPVASTFSIVSIALYIVAIVAKVLGGVLNIGAAIMATTIVPMFVLFLTAINTALFIVFLPKFDTSRGAPIVFNVLLALSLYVIFMLLVS